jgi:hypothetical protein
MACLLGLETLRAIVADEPDDHPVKRWRRTALQSGLRDDDIFISVIAVGILEDMLARFDQGSPAARAAFEHNVRVTLPSMFHNRILPISDLVARQWGRLRSIRDANDRLVPSETLLILSTAIITGIPYVGRRHDWMASLTMLGLTVIDPWAAPSGP